MRVINSHNFGGGGGAFSPSVNGKMPVAAWIPSRDDAANGTTTLNDLVGSNHGTLTNMVPATDWVADTGAGGVRALDFNGVNGFVNCGTIPGVNGATELSLTGWIWKGTTGMTVAFGCAAGPSDFIVGSRFSAIWFSNDRLFCSLGARGAFSSVSLGGTGWTHIAMCYDGSLAGNASRSRLYINGSFQSQSFAGSVPATLGTVVPNFALGMDSNNRFSAGRIDDVRIWDQALDATDVAYLYNNGNGRGVDAS